MSPKRLSPLLRQLRPADLRGAAQLAVKASASVTDVVEGVHQSVLGSLGFAPAAEGQRTRGIPGLVYQGVRGVTELVGKGLDKSLETWASLQAETVSPDGAAREIGIAALNGVMGDCLVRDRNPLAIGMSLRAEGQSLLGNPVPALATATDRIMLFVHGLCMTDSQWRPSLEERESVDLSEVVARHLGYTPVFVRYNTGLHTSQNGRELSRLLGELVRAWPVAVSEISVVAHSMGGLVMRSAMQLAGQQLANWSRHVKHLVFLGTPHHGAPLERAGHWVDLILESNPYTAPFGKLAQLRSAGITDLRYGHVADADWIGKDRFRPSPAPRAIVPLPQGVACYAVAATTSASRGVLADHLVGDGLVPVNSALGHHRDPKRRLLFKPSAQWIAFETGHIALMKSPAVAAQLRVWLSIPPS